MGQMQFSESNGPWRTVPPWADFLVTLGFKWLVTEPMARRIGIVSMPCDSAAAGLIALGAMRRRLECQNANDAASHFQRIEALLSSGGSHTFLRHRTLKGRFVVEKRDEIGLWVRQESSATALRTVILPGQAIAWRFDGEAPVQTAGEEVPYRRLYEELVNGAGAVLTSNLATSDSGVCLAGRVSGESASQTILATCRFRTTNSDADLSQLLTVQRWLPGRISRVSFFNARTGQADRNSGSPTLVVADGDAAFLRIVDATEFRQCDVVGVIHRAVDRDRLETIGVKIADLGQWYAGDTALPESLTSPPRGIAVSLLIRRS
jgi:hypothetical protein